MPYSLLSHKPCLQLPMYPHRGSAGQLHTITSINVLKRKIGHKKRRMIDFHTSVYAFLSPGSGKRKAGNLSKGFLLIFSVVRRLIIQFSIVCSANRNLSYYHSIKLKSKSSTAIHSSLPANLISSSSFTLQYSIVLFFRSNSI